MAIDILGLGISIDTSQVKTASKDLDKLSVSAHKTNASINGVGASSKQAGADFMSLSNAAGLLAKGYIYLQGAKAIIDITDEHTKYVAQLKIATNSTAEFNQALSKSQEIAAIAQTSVASVATVYARFANALKEANVSQEKIGLVAENVALGLKVSGANAGETSSAMLQLSQAFGSGVLAGEEFKAMSENAPPLMRALADSMGVPVGQLKALAAEGKITADTLVKAFSDTALNEKLRTQAEQVKTIGGAFVNLFEQIKLSINSFGGVGSTVNIFTSAVEGLTSALAVLSGTKDIDIKINVQFPNYEAYRKRMDEIDRDLKSTGQKASTILPSGSRMDAHAPQVDIGKIGDVDEAFSKLRADFTAWQKLEPLKDATQKALEYTKNLKMVSDAEAKGIISMQEAARYRTQFRKELEASGKAERDANEAIAKAKRDVIASYADDLTAIFELNQGELDSISIMQQRLDLMTKLPPAMRELAQEQIDLARANQEFADSIQQTNDVMQATQEYDDASAERSKAFEDEYNSILRQTEDLNTAMIINDEARAAKQVEIEHNRRAEQYAINKDWTQEEIDLAIEAENARYEIAKQNISSTRDLVKELGLTFTSAFEDAIVAGKGLSDVLKGIAQDIVRLMARKLVTDPLMGATQDILGGVFDNFGGFRASGGAVSAGTPYMVGERGAEMFVPSTSGAIVPNNQLGGQVNNVSITINDNGQRQEQGNTTQVAKQIEAAVIKVLIDQKRQGGVYA